MTREQRIAISRVISDMIKADNIIEETEIRDMKRLMQEFSLSHQDMADARNIKFSDALPILREMPLREREMFVNKIYGIAQSDKICVPREALLLLALQYCLIDVDKKGKDGSLLPKPYLVSCATGETTLNDQYMVYIESSYNKEMNEQIERHFRLLVTISRLCGFNFIYIPKMVSEFKNMRKEYVLDVISYMAPDLNPKYISEVYERLCRMTTNEFFKNVLYERLQVHPPHNLGPSLLINIGTSVVPYCSVGGPIRYYTEFLCIPITDDIVTLVDSLLSFYQSRVSVRQSIIFGDGKGRFRYFGFYKALFDFLIAPPPVAPDLIFLGQNMKSGRYQIAFRFEGGYEKIVDLTPKEYKIYLKIAVKSYDKKFLGLPVGIDKGIKSVISHIKNKISNAVPDLTYSEQYKPIRYDNSYQITLDKSKVFVRTSMSDCNLDFNDIPIFEYK